MECIVKGLDNREDIVVIIAYIEQKDKIKHARELVNAIIPGGIEDSKQLQFLDKTILSIPS